MIDIQDRRLGPARDRERDRLPEPRTPRLSDRRHRTTGARSADLGVRVSSSPRVVRRLSHDHGRKPRPQQNERLCLQLGSCGVGGCSRDRTYGLARSTSSRSSLGLVQMNGLPRHRRCCGGTQPLRVPTATIGESRGSRSRSPRRLSCPMTWWCISTGLPRSPMISRSPRGVLQSGRTKVGSTDSTSTSRSVRSRRSTRSPIPTTRAGACGLSHLTCGSPTSAAGSTRRCLFGWGSSARR